MYKNILIPTDGSALAAKAVTAGVALAKTVGASITVLMVSEPFAIFSLTPDQLEYSQGEYSRHVSDESRKVLDGITRQALEAGVPCETVLREHAHPYEAIIETGKARSCDLILMASHGRRGMAALVLGSVTVKVLTHSTIPVLVYR